MLKHLKSLFFDSLLARKRQFLKSLEMFSGLSERELGRLAQALHVRVYQPGELLFAEGDIGRALFILESGRIELTRRDGEGRPRVLHTLQPGDFFGEMALLEQLPRTATATAVERSRVYLLYRSKLDGLLDHHPRAGAQIMAHLAQLLSARLRRALAGQAQPAPIDA